jgi:hypothetical protein
MRGIAVVLAILVGAGALLVSFSALGAPAIVVGLGGLTACGVVATLYAWRTLDRETFYLVLLLIEMVCGVLMA